MRFLFALLAGVGVIGHFWLPIVIVIAWILFGVWGAKIADKKGRDPFGGFIFCFLLGLLGVAILKIMD